MDELGPVTRYMKAEEDASDLRIQLTASEGARITDNEALLMQIGELKGEVSRLSAIEELTFEYGTLLKCLVTALCPIIKRVQNPPVIDLSNWPDEWDEMVKCWEEARVRLSLSSEGNRVESEV